MTPKEIYKFIIEQSPEPLIKNPVLRKVVDQERLGFYLGKSVPSKGTIEDADTKKAEDALSGVNEVMKVADLQRQGHIGHFYADGGRIEFEQGKKVHSRRDVIDQKGIGEKILEEYEDGASTVDLQKKYKVNKDTINRYIKKNKPSILRSASQGINQYGFDKSVIDEIKIDAAEGFSRKEILEKYKGRISKNKLKQVIDAENIEVEPYYKEGEVKGYKYNMEDLKKFASDDQNARLAQAKKDLKAGKITQDQYSNIEYKYRRAVLTSKRYGDLPYEVRRQKYLDREASKTDEQKAADAERKRKYEDKRRAQYGSDPIPRKPKDALWRDIARSAKEGKGKGRIRFVEDTYIDPKKGNYQDFKNRRFIDTRNTTDVKKWVEFGYDDLEKYLDSGKAGKYKYADAIEPYEIKFEINKAGLREEINKNFFGKDYKPRGPFNPKNAFHVHHVAGIVNDPFDVQFTFSDQNMNLMTNKTFNKEFKNLINNKATYTQKKNFIKSATAKIGDNIAQKFGKKQYGTRRENLSGMFEKVGLDPNRPEVRKIIEKQTANNLNKAGFDCEFAGSSGGLGSCDNPRAYRKSIQETMEKASKGDNAAVRKIQNLGKTMNKLTKAARLTGWGLLTEVGFAAPFAFLDYAKGANKDEIISNATFGFFGKSIDEQLREQNPGYGQAADLQKAYEKELQIEQDIKDSVGGYQGIAQNTRMLEDARDATDKALDPFLMPTPHLESGRYFDPLKVEKNFEYTADTLKDFLDKKEEKSKQRGILLPSTGLEAVELAGGGIASLPGVRQGPAPLSGPLPDGLPFVPNRVTKI